MMIELHPSLTPGTARVYRNLSSQAGLASFPRPAVEIDAEASK
jgi:hypothetical protein